ncbi:MAG TPA: FMN-binding protein [Thermoanaerobaculia bacterium]|jgi:hypothetical protein
MTRVALAALVIVSATTAGARVFMTQQQALAGAFPAGTKVVRQTFFLSPQQSAAAKKESGVEFRDRMIVRYAGSDAAGTAIGYAYFDTHMVRTLPETVMVVVGSDGRVQKVDILSFDEPPDYMPKQRWIDQLRGRKLDDDLSLKRAIRPITGASLSGRAIVNASRKILALHRLLPAQ